ncbi:MAG: hypothetical protein WDN26_06085 [Chitinophagaceae bacterium]
MEQEDYWNILLDIVINIGRQTDKDKIELCKNSIGPKEPEKVLPLTLWTYHQSWGVFWKLNISEVSDVIFKSKVDDKQYRLRQGLKIILEEYTQEAGLTKMNENIWSLEEIFLVNKEEDDWGQRKQGWLYEEFEGLVEIIEIILLNNLFISEDMAKDILELQKDFTAKKEAEDQQIQNEIDELKKRNGW